MEMPESDAHDPRRLPDLGHESTIRRIKARMMTDRLRYVASATILRDAMVRVQRIATGTGDADLYAIASAALDEATELESVEDFTISQKRVRDAMNRLALNGQQEGTSTVYLDNKVGESGERVVVLRADEVLEIAFLLTLVPVTDNHADIAPALARARARRKGPPAGDLVHGPVGRPDTGHRPHCRWQWSECTCWSEEEGKGDE